VVAQQQIQNQVEVAAEFINVICIYSILDEAEFRPSNRWMSYDDKEEFKAWVHIRHTRAHAHAPGGRALRYYAEFDAFMASGIIGRSGLKQKCQGDADSIVLP
jgi:hypothetical protein